MSIPHGTESEYTYHKCRCGECREAAREIASQRRAFWGNPMNYRWEMPWHGTPYGYSHYGCHCDDCKDGMRAYRKKRNNR